MIAEIRFPRGTNRACVILRESKQNSQQLCQPAAVMLLRCHNSNRCRNAAIPCAATRQQIAYGVIRAD
jgi:hypothetical protein